MTRTENELGSQAYIYLSTYCVPAGCEKIVSASVENPGFGGSCIGCDVNHPREVVEYFNGDGCMKAVVDGEHGVLTRENGFESNQPLND